MYEGDLNYLGEQQEYMRSLLRVLASQMDGDRENLQGGQRLLDWPTSQMPDVIHAGYQALMVMAMEAGAEIGGWQMQSECRGALRRLRRHVPDHLRNKQRVGGSNPSAPTNQKAVRDACRTYFQPLFSFLSLRSVRGEKCAKVCYFVQMVLLLVLLKNLWLH